jgi:hypothetical protein
MLNFYLYHEGQAKRGPNEICSLLVTYTTNHIPGTFSELRINSSSCPDQNRNHTIVRFLAKFAANGRSNKILQCFSVRGPCDRDFGFIKELYKKYICPMVYIPEDYRKLIGQSSGKGKFSVS